MNEWMNEMFILFSTNTIINEKQLYDKDIKKNGSLMHIIVVNAYCHWKKQCMFTCLIHATTV